MKKKKADISFSTPTYEAMKKTRGDSMNENECKGCVYDLTNKNVTNKERLNHIIENCCYCKRGVKEEYQDMYSDLYKPGG